MTAKSTLNAQSAHRPVDVETGMSKEELWVRAYEDSLDLGKTVPEAELMADDAVAKALFRRQSSSGRLLDPHQGRRRSLILEQYNLSEADLMAAEEDDH